MQGDAYNNQHISSLQQDSSVRFNPWTHKATATPAKELSLRWCWAWSDTAWLASVQFIIGSVLFLVSSVADVSLVVDQDHRKWIVSWPQMLGSLLFTVGSACLLYESVQGHPNSARLPESVEAPASRRGCPGQERPSTEEPLLHSFAGRWMVTEEKGSTGPAVQDTCNSADWQEGMARTYLQSPLFHVQGDPWYHLAWRLDVAGSVLLLLGAAIYNTSCVSHVWKDYHGEWPLQRPDAEWWLVWLPNTLGGVLFVAGSWLYWAAAHHTFSFIGFEPFDLTTYVITHTNLWGSLGFLIGDAVTHPLVPIPRSDLKPSWLQLLLGHGGGSLAFLIGSWLMVAQTAKILQVLQ